MIVKFLGLRSPCEPMTLPRPLACLPEWAWVLGRAWAVSRTVQVVPGARWGQCKRCLGAGDSASGAWVLGTGREPFKFGEHGSGRTKAPGLRREC